MSFRDTLKADKFLITVDTMPPKGTDLSGNLRRLESLKGRVDAVNVADMPSAVMRMSALPVCHLLKKEGFEPILQITCRDRNRLGLQADLLGAAALGIENLLLLSGDKVDRTNDPDVKGVFDLDAVELIEVAKGLEAGYDKAGSELRGCPRYCLGAAVDPAAEALAEEIEKMERKVSAGAEFFQTQPVYSIDAFLNFREKVKHLDVNIIAGIFLLKSGKMARSVNERVPGINVPESVIREMEQAKDPVAKSIEIAARTITELRPLANGVHIMTLHWEDKVQRVLDSLEPWRRSASATSTD